MNLLYLVPYPDLNGYYMNTKGTNKYETYFWGYYVTLKKKMPCPGERGRLRWAEWTDSLKAFDVELFLLDLWALLHTVSKWLSILLVIAPPSKLSQLSSENLDWAWSLSLGLIVFKMIHIEHS